MSKHPVYVSGSVSLMAAWTNILIHPIVCAIRTLNGRLMDKSYCITSFLFFLFSFFNIKTIQLSCFIASTYLYFLFMQLFGDKTSLLQNISNISFSTFRCRSQESHASLRMVSVINHYRKLFELQLPILKTTGIYCY